MAGGRRQSKRAGLTADQVARAVIAAAGAWGQDPMRALALRQGPGRRCVVVAAEGLIQVLGVDQERACALLGTARSSIRRLRLDEPVRFAAALGAVRAALGPVARVEVVAVVESDLAKVGDEAPSTASRSPSPERGGEGARVVLAPGVVRRRVREILETDNATAPDLAAAIGVAEAAVREALRWLAEAGEAVAEPMTAQGWRMQFWRRAASR